MGPEAHVVAELALEDGVHDLRLLEQLLVVTVVEGKHRVDVRVLRDVVAALADLGRPLLLRVELRSRGGFGESLAGVLAG